MPTERHSRVIEINFSAAASTTPTCRNEVMCTSVNLAQLAVAGSVANPKLLFSDPDPDPTWRVVTKPYPTWRVITDPDSDPDPNLQVVSNPDPSFLL